MRRVYTKQHRFYCGIDLHARLLAICIVDHHTNEVVLRRQIPADQQLLLHTLAPYRPDVCVCVECLFAWYWVADLCKAEGLPFVLGHALYMKAIHGGKAKNDAIDAEKIARLLRGGNIPVAYVYRSSSLAGAAAKTSCRALTSCGPGQVQLVVLRRPPHSVTAY
jgi:transposase